MVIKKPEMRLGGENLYYSKELGEQRAKTKGEKAGLLRYAMETFHTKLQRIAYAFEHHEWVSNKRQIKRLSNSIEDLNQKAHASLNQTDKADLTTDFETLNTAIQEADEIIGLLRKANADEKALNRVSARLQALTRVKEVLGTRLKGAEHRPQPPSSPPKNSVQKPFEEAPKAVASAPKPLIQTEDGNTHPVALVPKDMTATLVGITPETEVTVNQELLGSLHEGETVEKTFEDPQVQDFIRDNLGGAFLGQMGEVFKGKTFGFQKTQNPEQIKVICPPLSDEPASTFLLTLKEVPKGLTHVAVETASISPLEADKTQIESGGPAPLSENEVRESTAKEKSPEQAASALGESTSQTKRMGLFGLATFLIAGTALLASNLATSLAATSEAGHRTLSSQQNSGTVPNETIANLSHTSFLEVPSQAGSYQSQSTMLPALTVGNAVLLNRSGEVQQQPVWQGEVPKNESSVSNEMPSLLEPQQQEVREGQDVPPLEEPPASGFLVTAAAAAAAAYRVASSLFSRKKERPIGSWVSWLSTDVHVLKTKLRELAQRYGWKTANLIYLRALFRARPSLNAEVPEFAGIEHQAVLNHVRRHYDGFDRDWEAFKREFALHHDLTRCKPTLEAIQSNIRKVFITHPMEHAGIQEFVGKGMPLMVRSTGREDDPGENEDGSDAVSNPGGNLSLSNVAPNAAGINQAIGNVVASYFSFNSLNQRNESHDDITVDPFMPILLQEMAGEKEGGAIPVSGVMYTREPDLLTEGVTFIDAAPGHAELVVTGSAPSDFFYVHGDVVHQGCQEKVNRLKPNPAGGLTSVPNPKELVFSPSLTETEARQLSSIGAVIEKGYSGNPMDVEWSLNPRTGKVSVFQARRFKPTPLQAPTHIDPNKIRDLEGVTQASVVVPAQGPCAMKLNETNTAAFESANAAKDYCAKNPHIKTIILKSFIRKNSHEAGYFRSIGISVINPRPNEYSNLARALKSRTLLADPGEGLIGIVPEGHNPDDYIVGGLRRHLAPKTESHGAKLSEGQKRQFFRELVNLSNRANSASALQAIKSAPGRNLMDKHLNAYEAATNDFERAFILQKILKMTRRLIKEAHPQQADRFFDKVVSNAHHVFSTRNASELEKKFAMNWLRTALLQEKESHIFESDTLYSLMGEHVERKTIHQVAATEHQDVFLRCAKFMISPETKRAWTSFCRSLSPEQEQELAKILTQLGSQVTPLWMNSSFLSAYQASREDAADCMALLLKEMASPNVARALEISKRTKEMVQKIRPTIENLENPDFPSFSDMFHEGGTYAGLIRLAEDCIEVMQESSGLTAALASQAFNEIVSTYDDSVKALTGSPHYADQLELKAKRFYDFIFGYLYIARRAMAKEVLQDKALTEQAKILISFCERNLDRLKQRIDADVNIPQMLKPTDGFSASVISLGSNFLAPERACRGLSLEDLFTVTHQSLLTTSQVVASRGGLKLEQLPEPLQSTARSLLSLNTAFAGDDTSTKPSIQSIEYNHPKIKVTFNFPLNHHSAVFALEGTFDRNGQMKQVTFDGAFICPIGMGAFGRSISLGSYFLSTMYAKGEVPPGLKFEMDDTHVKFQYEISLEEGLKQDDMTRLQNMISYLQRPRQYKLRYETFDFLKDYPQYIPQCEETFYLDKHACPMLVRSLIKIFSSNPTEENLKLFLTRFHRFRYHLGTTDEFVPILMCLVAHDAFWKSEETLERLVELLNFVNLRWWERQSKSERHSEAEHIAKLKALPPELMTAIKKHSEDVTARYAQLQERENAGTLDYTEEGLFKKLDAFVVAYWECFVLPK